MGFGLSGTLEEKKFGLTGDIDKGFGLGGSVEKQPKQAPYSNIDPENPSTIGQMITGFLGKIDNAEKVSEKFLSNVKKSFKRGSLSAELDQAAYLAMTGALDYERDVKPLMKERDRIINADPVKGGNIISDAIYKVSEMLPAMGAGMAEGLASGGIAGGTAAATGIGASVALPMFAAGNVVGSMSYWYRQGAGQLYAEMRDEGIEDHINKPIASVAGAAYAGIEFSQIDKMVPGAAKIAKESVKQGTANLVKRLAVKYGTNWAQEVGEEGLQEMVMTTAKEAAAKVAEKSDKTAGQITEQVIQDGWEAMKQSALPMLLLLGPGAATDAVTAQGEQKILDTIGKEKVKRAAEELAAEKAEQETGPYKKQVFQPKDIPTVVPPRKEQVDIAALRLELDEEAKKTDVPAKKQAEITERITNLIVDTEQAIADQDVKKADELMREVKRRRDDAIAIGSGKRYADEVKRLEGETRKMRVKYLTTMQHEGPLGPLTEEDAKDAETILRAIGPEDSAVIAQMGEKRASDVLYKAYQGRNLTEPQRRDLQDLLDEYRENWKDDLEPILQEVEDAGSELTEQETEEILKILEAQEELDRANDEIDGEEEIGSEGLGSVKEQQGEQKVSYKFKGTEEAIKYGKSIQSDASAVSDLKDALQAKNVEADAVLDIENPTKEQQQQGINLAVESQLLREAVEAAEGKTPEISINKDKPKKKSRKNLDKLKVIFTDSPLVSGGDVSQEDLKIFLSEINSLTIKSMIGEEVVDYEDGNIVVTKSEYGGGRYLYRNTENDIVGALNFVFSQEKGSVLSNIYVAPEYRRKGVGTELYVRAISDMPGMRVDSHLTEAGAKFFGFDFETEQQGGYGKSEGFPIQPPTERPLDPVQGYNPHKQPMRLKKPEGVVKSTDAPEIIDGLADAIKAFGGTTPIRTGKVKGKRKAGFFVPHTEVIRIKVANNIPVATHEVGHALEKMMRIEDPGVFLPKGAGREATNDMQSQLQTLGKLLYGANEPHNGYESEGIAEFMRLYVTDTPEAKKRAPDFFRYFEETFLARHPEGKAALEKVVDKARRWQQMGSQGRAKASIVEPNTLKQKAQSVQKALDPEGLIQSHIDMLQPLKNFAREVEKRTGMKLKESDNPYTIAAALRTTHDARTRYMVEKGMIDISGNIVGRPLSDITKLVKGRQQDFTIYLWALRAKALWLGSKNGPRNPGLSLEDANQIIDELATTDFVFAAQMVYGWNDGVLNYAAQASPTFARAVDKIREVDPGYYIPLQREFRNLDNLWSKRGTQTNARGGKVSAKLKGSGRRIKDPFPQMIANARKVVKAAHDRAVIDAIIKLSRVEGMGYLVEKVPKDMVPGVSRNLLELTNVLAKELGEIGISIKVEGEEGPLTDDEMLDLMMQTVTFFTPAQYAKGEDPIIPIVNGKKIEWYQLDGNIYRALDGMEVYRMPQVAGFGIMEWIFAKPARMFRAGTTGLRASFGLIANPIRDWQTFYMNSQANTNAGMLFLDWVRSMSGAAFRATTGIVEPYLDAFVRLGGEMAQPLGQDIPQTKRAARRLFEGRTVKVLDPRNWFDWYRDFVQFPESAARVAELRRLAKETGWEPGMPMSFDQSLRLLLAAKQVTTDFTAMGEFSRVMNQIVPFYNSAIQGPRANIRALKRNPQRFIIRGLAITASTLALWWRQKDEEWYKEMPAREKFLYWHFPIDWPEPTLIRIPRAFEIGQVFASMPEAFMDSWYRQNPEAAKEWYETFQETSNPVGFPVLMEEALEQAANRDFFWEGPIVKQSLQRRPAEEQYDEYTSRVSIFLGQMFKASPKRIEHAIVGVTGYVSQDIIDVVGLGPKGVDREKELADTPLIGRLFQRGGEMSSRPKSVTKLYERLEEATLKQYSTKHQESKKEKQIRLMMTDATRAIGNLYYVRSQTKETDKRREIMDEILSIAQEANEAAESGKIMRGRFRQARKKSQMREDRLKKESGK